MEKLQVALRQWNHAGPYRNSGHVRTPRHVRRTVGSVQMHQKKEGGIKNKYEHVNALCHGCLGLRSWPEP